MGEFDIVIVAGSQGALVAHRQLFGGLAPGLAATVIVVQHRLPDDGMFASLLGRYANLPVCECGEREELRAGLILLAAADRQLLVRDAHTAVLDCARERAASPCLADPVMASAATACGSRVLGVVLSGRLDDGAAGVRAIKRAGGRVIVQTPASARSTSMPNAALATGCVDLCLDPPRIAAAISAFVAVPGCAALFGRRPTPWAWPVGN